MKDLSAAQRAFSSYDQLTARKPSALHEMAMGGKGVEGHSSGVHSQWEGTK